MAETSITPNGSAYIEALERALAGVAVATRDGILDGVREELGGLDAEEVRRRIAELGDPEYIAAAAKAEGEMSPEAAVPETFAARSSGNSVQRGEPRWFSVVAAVLVMVGGFVIPFVGALAGIVMMWFSTVWTRKQKLIATLVPVGLAASVVVLAIVLSAVTTPQQPNEGDVRNPLIPAGFDVVTIGFLLVVVANVAVGVWLLVTAMRTGSTTTRGSHRTL